MFFYISIKYSVRKINKHNKQLYLLTKLILLPKDVHDKILCHKKKSFCRYLIYFLQTLVISLHVNIRELKLGTIP